MKRKAPSTPPPPARRRVVRRGTPGQASPDLREKNRELELEIDRLKATVGKAAAEWRFTIDAIPDLVLVFDDRGEIHRLNRSALARLGGTYNDWVGQPLQALESRQPFDMIVTCAQRLFADAQGQTERLRDDRVDMVWDVSCTRWDTQPDRRMAVVVARNVTDMVRLEESLVRTESMAEMGRLLGAVAHEVRNPLFGISALLEAWSVNLSTADPHDYFSLLTGEVERLRTLMVDLLEYGRPFSATMRPGSLQGVVLDAVRSCERQAAAAGVTLTSSLTESLIRMDATRLPRVFTNLLENAIQHSSVGSAVSIATQSDGAGSAHVAVTDSGPGFTDDAIRHLFTPFFSRRRGGTGLGLAIAKRIVDEHDGRIAVHNNPGGGATLTVTLPLAD